MTEAIHLAWRKSSYSNGSGGNCLEVVASAGEALARDSKDPEGPVLAFSLASWSGFVSAVREQRLGQILLRS
jgi:hypothetical protein